MRTVVRSKAANFGYPHCQDGVRDYGYVRHGMRSVEVVGCQGGGRDLTARFGGVTGGADDGGRRVHFQIPVRNDGVTFLPSGCGVRKNIRVPRILRGRGRSRVPTGGGIHAIGPRRGVRVLVPERSRRWGEGGTGVDAGADDHQPPDPSASGWHR